MKILVVPTWEFVLWERHIDQIRAAAPGAVVRVVPAKEVAREDVAEADIVFGRPNLEWVETSLKLRWMHLASAGADGTSHLRPDLILTKSSGVFGIPISEWVIGSMLTLARSLHLYRDQQWQTKWVDAPGGREVHGSTVGIIGMGDLGREIAKRAQALGCRVIGSRRTPTAAAPDFFDAVMPIDELLPQVDWLVLAVPNTPETARLLSAARLNQLKPGAVFINVGRGQTVDEEALIFLLQNGHLAGAALDVTAVEPLPPESPLWRMENVLISPHASGRSPEGNADRRTALFCDNLRRYLAGEPLRNLVDRKAGY